MPVHSPVMPSVGLRIGRVVSLAVLAFLPELAAAQAVAVSGVAAWRSGANFRVQVTLAAPLPGSGGVALTACRVGASGKDYLSGRTVQLVPRGGNVYTYRAGATSGDNVEVLAGDSVDLSLLVGGQPTTRRVVVGSSEPAVPTRVPSPTPVPTPTATPRPAATPTPRPAEPEPVEEVDPLPVLPDAPALANMSSTAAPAVAMQPTPVPAAKGLERTVPSLPVDVGSAPVQTGGAGVIPEAAAAEGEALPVEDDSPDEASGSVLPIAAGAAGLLALLVGGGVLAARRGSGRRKEAPRAGLLDLEPAAGATTAAAPRAEAAPAETFGQDGLRVESQIARGGLCDIFLAHQAAGRRRVALKVLRPEFRMSDRLKEGLVREAEIIRRMNERYPDEPIVKLCDQGWFHDGEVAHPYLLLEYVDGPNLKAWVRRHGVLPPVEALRAVRSVASALGAIHAENFVHGDVSPENVLFLEKHPPVRMPYSRYRLIDFGDAQKFDFSSRADEITGKPSFLSPEQASGFPATPASDVYSLGMILYFLFLGRPAFESTNSLDVLKMHLEADIVFPPECPADVVRAVRRMCSKLPLTRPDAAGVVRLADELLKTRGDV